MFNALKVSLIALEVRKLLKRDILINTNLYKTLKVVKGLYHFAKHFGSKIHCMA